MHAQRAELARSVPGNVALQRWETLVTKLLEKQISRMQGAEGHYWRLTSVVKSRRVIYDDSDEHDSGGEGEEKHQSSKWAGSEAAHTRGSRGRQPDEAAGPQPHVRLGDPKSAFSGAIDAKDMCNGAGVREGSNGAGMHSRTGVGGMDGNVGPLTSGGRRVLEDEVAGLSTKMTSMLEEMRSLRSVSLC